ncbi:MAG: hypothetical protein DWP97_03840 [Calditrichaeota bacterium]|nr:MAG: hypothetical protein DWP97_03840 [Calditrichota bacterium]
MTRIIHIIKELFRNLYKNPGTTLSAILTMTLLFLLFDLFWIGTNTTDRFYQEYISELNMEVFVAENIPDSTVKYIQEAISQIDGVTIESYFSKEDAREELMNIVGIDLLVGYEATNPLPRSILLSFEPEMLSTLKLNEVENQISKIEGVSYVYYSKSWLTKVEQTKSLISDFGLFLGGLILLTVLVSSANNMRLTAKTRAVGFKQMRLLGAGKIILAFPFFIEGILLGAISGGLGWGLIFYVKSKFEITKFTIVYPTFDEILIYCALTGLLGLISSYVGIKRLLRL